MRSVERIATIDFVLSAVFREFFSKHIIFFNFSFLPYFFIEEKNEYFHSLLNLVLFSKKSLIKIVHNRLWLKIMNIGVFLLFLVSLF